MTAPGFDGSIKIDTSVDSKGFDKGVEKMSKNFQSGVGGMVASIATLGLAIVAAIGVGVAAAVDFGSKSVEAANDTKSAFIGLKSVLDGTGKSFAGAQEFIKNYVQDGLVPLTDAVVAYKNLALRGYSDDQIQKTLTSLKDSAAFGRQSTLSLGEAVRSAAEGLKNENSILVDNAGVTKNVAKMWKDYADSLGVTTDSLTKEQKIEAEVAGIMEESRFQVGDAAKLADTYAGKIAALGVSFQNLKVAVGNSLIPILTMIVPYIKQAVDWMTVLFTQFAGFMNVFFGIKDIMGGAAKSTINAADAANVLGDKLSKAEKKAKGALAAFDMINVLQQKEDDNNGGGDKNTTINSPTIALPVPEKSGLDKAKDQFMQWKDSLMALLDPAIKAFERLKIALGPLGETIWKGLQWAWEHILVPLGKWVITDILPIFLDMLGAGFKVLNSVLVALQPLWDWLWTNVLLPLAPIVADVIVYALKTFVWILEQVSIWIDNNQALFRTFVVILAGFAAVVFLVSNPLGWLILALMTLIGFVKSLIDVFNLAKDGIPKVWDAIKFAWANAGTWFQVTVIDPVKNKFLSAFDYIKNGAKTALDNLFVLFAQIKGWIDEKITNPMKSAFGGSLDYIKAQWKATFDGIYQIIKGILNNVIDLVNTMMDRMTNGINDVIDSMNGVGSNFIPGWNDIGYLHAPRIPRLATGAVIPPNSEFMAILGDQKSGRNIEAPEGLIRQIIREELGGGLSGHINIGFDDSAIGVLVRSLKPHLDKEDIRIGSNLIKGSVSI